MSTLVRDIHLLYTTLGRHSAICRQGRAAVLGAGPWRSVRGACIRSHHPASGEFTPRDEALARFQSIPVRSTMHVNLREGRRGGTGMLIGGRISDGGCSTRTRRNGYGRGKWGRQAQRLGPSGRRVLGMPGWPPSRGAGGDGGAGWPRRDQLDHPRRRLGRAGSEVGLRPSPEPLRPLGCAVQQCRRQRSSDSDRGIDPGAVAAGCRGQPHGDVPVHPGGRPDHEAPGASGRPDHQ